MGKTAVLKSGIKENKSAFETVQYRETEICLHVILLVTYFDAKWEQVILKHSVKAGTLQADVNELAVTKTVVASHQLRFALEHTKRTKGAYAHSAPASK